MYQSAHASNSSGGVEVDRDPTFGGIVRYGTRTTEYPADGGEGEVPWAQTTDTGVIMVSTDFFGQESNIASLANTVRSPVTVYMCAETIGFFEITYYVDGKLLRRVNQGNPNGEDIDVGQPLPYEVEIEQSWWGEDFHSHERFSSIFAETAHCQLDILAGTTSTEVIAPQLT